jgi:hypothetical protein
MDGISALSPESELPQKIAMLTQTWGNSYIIRYGSKLGYNYIMG